MVKTLRYACALAALHIILLASFPAEAADPSKTYQVAARAVGFVEGIGTAVTVGVVFDPAVAESVAAKDAIMAANASMKAGAVTLTAKPVELSALAGTGDIGAVYLTPGLASSFGAVQSYANSKKIPSLGADVACVKGGQCVVGAETEPSVQIYVNKAATAATGIKFQSAFTMMIKEL